MQWIVDYNVNYILAGVSELYFLVLFFVINA